MCVGECCITSPSAGQWYVTSLFVGEWRYVTSLLDSGTSPACVGECCITSLSVGECTSPVCLWESGTYTYVTSLSMGEWYVYVRHQSVYGRVVRICTSPVCRKVLHHQPVRGRVSKFNLMYFPPWGEPVRGSNQGSYLSAV